MFGEPGATRLLAISPHLDDAVLSLGAGLAQAAQDGAKVTVYTVFAGTAPPPYSVAAQRMHEIWGLSPNDDAPLYRRKEDMAALNHLGVDHRHGRFLDSIYRTTPDGRWLAEHATGGKKLTVRPQLAESTRELVSEITDDIKSVIDEFAPTLLVSCAAIGNHPDHEMARDAAIFAASEQGLPVRLWEDLPYAVTRSGTVELPSGFGLGSANFNPVKAKSRTRKFQALEHYPSQMLMLNGRDKNLFAQLEEHARKTSPYDGYGEKTWPVISHADHS